MKSESGHSPQDLTLQRAHLSPAAGHEDAPDVWPDDATRDRFVGDWWIWQRRKGHRTSTDDQLTAWSAVQAWEARAAARPARYLDLGCGIGSVMLAVAHALEPAETVGVEAQPQSVRMARRTIAELPGGAPPVEVRHGDLRALDPDELGRFPLITGSPPYIPPEAGTMAADPQRRACRFEIRGGVEGYCDAAAQLLSDDGSFHLVFQTVWDARVLAAATSAGLHLHGRLDALMRADRRDPFLTVYDFRREAPDEVARQLLVIREADGARSAAYDAVRSRLGMYDPVSAESVTQKPRAVDDHAH